MHAPPGASFMTPASSNAEYPKPGGGKLAPKGRHNSQSRLGNSKRLLVRILGLIQGLVRILGLGLEQVLGLVQVLRLPQWLWLWKNQPLPLSQHPNLLLNQSLLPPLFPNQPQFQNQSLFQKPSLFLSQ